MINEIPNVLTIGTRAFQEGTTSTMYVTDLSGTYDLTTFTVPTVTYTPSGGRPTNWPNVGPVTVYPNLYTASFPVTPPTNNRGGLAEFGLRIFRFFFRALYSVSTGSLSGNLQNGGGTVQLDFIPAGIFLATPAPNIEQILND